MQARPFGKVLNARKQKVSLPPNPDYNAPPLTVECLARLDSAQGFNILVASEPKDSGTHWELYSYAGSGVLSVYMPGYVPAEVRSSVVVTDGQWHYCAMTFDGRTLRIYVDGKLAQSERVRRQPGMAPRPGPLCVGHIAGTTLGCDGELDEVRVSSILRDVSSIPTAPFEDDADTLALWHFDPPFAATGVSHHRDPFQAGAEAALQARKSLGSAEVRAVVVVDSLEGDAVARKRMLEGIGWFIEPALVSGCSSFGPIVRQSASGTVAVLAFSEAVAPAMACEDIGPGHEDCGRRLGQRIRQMSSDLPPGDRLVVLLGDCHVPATEALVRGFLNGYGTHIPMVGGSCPEGGFLYHVGEVRQRVSLAICLSGEFRVSTALGQASGAEDVAASAARLASDVAGDDPSKALLSLVFSCVTRRQAIADNPQAELQAITDKLPVGSVFGFYGSGEIGTPAPNAAPRGVGGHLSLACLKSR